MTVPAVDVVPSITRMTWPWSTTCATVAIRSGDSWKPEPCHAVPQPATSKRTTPERTVSKACCSVDMVGVDADADGAVPGDDNVPAVAVDGMVVTGVVPALGELPGAPQPASTRAPAPNSSAFRIRFPRLTASQDSGC